MTGFNLPFEKVIRSKFSKKKNDIITPSSVATKHYNDKNLNKLFIGIKIIWFPVYFVSIFCFLILFVSLF